MAHDENHLAWDFPKRKKVNFGFPCFSTFIVSASIEQRWRGKGFVRGIFVVMWSSEKCRKKRKVKEKSKIMWKMIFPKIFWYYCILIFQVMCRDPPTVKIKDQGTVMGMFMNMYRTQRIVAYLGLPYAHPPLRMLRFSPPIVDNLPSWDGIRNGSLSQPNCWQNTNRPMQKHTMVLNRLLNKVMDIDSMMSDWGSDRYDEDCLYLNVFAPDGESSDGFCLRILHFVTETISI